MAGAVVVQLLVADRRTNLAGQRPDDCGSRAGFLVKHIGRWCRAANQKARTSTDANGTSERMPGAGPGAVRAARSRGAARGCESVSGDGRFSGAAEPYNTATASLRTCDVHKTVRVSGRAREPKTKANTNAASGTETPVCRHL